MRKLYWPSIDYILYWHYSANMLYEYDSSTGIDDHIRGIKAVKPEHEQETRLRLMRRIKNPPARLVEALAELSAAYDQSLVACEREQAVIDAHDRVEVAYYQARESCKAEMEALHKIECPNCPWDGKTIFPKEKT